ncbi:stalk domain-containing protein [Paenibacillus chondroitinus]|uniref:Stalk domain-containing protein n=1 Tax=Paenibacillus chondroitinus TaxID=59842 RepID=A0ABU6DJC1_9BACL|nr:MULTISPECIES: stalk domain-containing protein [Paenibacillus]MCY9661308.1 stalk domain-containing protein [Paenibacillus anseongense]MEB4797611.1 stalk domain-containing protein [Paenibacillus chondroitinus]
MKWNALRKEITVMLALLVFLASAISAPAAHAVSASSSFILLYIDKSEAFVNEDQIHLESPATIINGSTFVPAKFLGDTMGFKVEWNNDSRTIQMTPPGYNIVLDADHKTVTTNGVDTPFNSVAAIVNGKLLVKLTWLADYMGAKYTYNSELRRVEIVHFKTPEGIYIDQDSNSRPVAKFATAKPTYRLGEPVKYVDLSYDPDAEGIASYDWVGKEEAFFKPGKYPVTLTVKDRHGHESKLFKSYVTVEDVPYLNQVEYPIYTAPVGSFIKSDWGTIWSHFNELPMLPKKVTELTDRTLLVSDSPEEFTEKGILYQDKINGKARLYADHINGTKQIMTMAIFATNNTDKPVTIKTTNKGEVYPSVYANLIGSEASVDFLLNNVYTDTMTVAPHETYVYAKLPDFYPGQGVNLFYDVETNGELQMSFAVTDQRLTSNTVKELPLLAFNGHVRGTFPVSEIKWDIDAASFAKTSVLTIGDNKTDPFVKGYDVMRKQNVENGGNYGVVYKIHSDKPRKMAVMIMARGGVFKGPFKINGEIVPVPSSGVITAFDGMEVLARTTGTEDALDIEFTPPAGSAFPIDLIFYPLDEKK